MKSIRGLVLVVGAVLVLAWVVWAASRPSEPAPPVYTLQAPQIRMLNANRIDPADPKHLRNPFPQLRLMPRRAASSFTPASPAASAQPAMAPTKPAPGSAVPAPQP